MVGHLDDNGERACDWLETWLEAIRRLFRANVDWTDNQPPLPVIFPDQLA